MCPESPQENQFPASPRTPSVVTRRPRSDATRRADFSSIRTPVWSFSMPVVLPAGLSRTAIHHGRLDAQARTVSGSIVIQQFGRSLPGCFTNLPRYPVPGPPSCSCETPRRVAEARRIDDRAMRCNQNPLKTNAQRHSYSRTPLAAMLYSRRVINVLHSRSVHRTTARHRLPYRPHVRYLFAKFATSRPDRRQPPRSPAIGRI